MIINWSRVQNFGKCPEKAWNWDELHLEQFSPELPLMQGGAFHDGVAQYFATRSVDAAVDAVEHHVHNYLDGRMVFPEDKPQIEHAVAWSQLAVKKFAASYETQPIQVLWPEVRFMIPLPNSHHHCWFMHRLFCEGEYQYCPVEHYLRAEAHRPLTPQDLEYLSHFMCWQPHYFRGKTDAVVSLDGQIFLFEHKTNSVKMEMFISKFYLDGQATGYMYGVSRQMGVPIAGFILNVIQKPHPNMKDQMQVGFAREMFFRTEEDLLDFEGEFTQQANHYEAAFRDRALGNQFAVVRNTWSCTDWGRKCPYFSKCQRHPREALEGEFAVRNADYVEEAYHEVFNHWKEQQQCAS